MCFDQLSRTRGALADADPARDRILMIESQAALTSRRWHRQKIHFLLSSARHFAQTLSDEGFDVAYEVHPNMSAGIRQHVGHSGEMLSTTPTSHAAVRRLATLGVTLVPNDLFLTSHETFEDWAAGQRTLTMENFYRLQRRRLDILMDGAEPLGGTWNLDADNRLPPPKEHDWPTPLTFEMDDIDLRVAASLSPDLWGAAPSGIWATTRAGALAALAHFLEYNFANFGPYEDAMPRDSWAGHHSLLSPYLNVGLLDPREVVDAALVRFADGDIPLASCEGFIRQIIGWREYVNGVYWHFPEDYQQSNALNAFGPVPAAFHDAADTSMQCLSEIIGDIHDRAWVHHIPRLMVLSNLALEIGISPRAYLDWMRSVFIDAYEWVMVPNVIGMGTYADGGTMMTKPYAAGGAYISRMGQYCPTCPFDPRKRTGPDACPFTALYWTFLDEHREQLAGNHRMSRQLANLDRLSDLDAVRLRSKEVLRDLQ